MKNVFNKYLLPVLAVGMLVFSIYQVVQAQKTSPQPQPPIDPPRTPFGRTVAGAGIVEAETENFSIGAPLPGVIMEVYVPVEMVGKIVKKGDPLFLVDTRQLKAQLEYQKANLEAAKAQLAKLDAQPRPEEVPPSRAAVKAAQSNLELQEDNVKRYTELRPTNAIPEKDWKQSILSADQARHQLAQAKANLDLLEAGAWKYDKDIARANVALAKAQVEQTQTDIDRSLVCAPIDGRVLQVNVRPGEYAGTPPSQALVVLGRVAKLHIRVDIDEHDIPRAYKLFHEDIAAVASPRGDPSMKFPLKFVRVEPYVIPKKSLTGDNTERVDTRVLQVIYRVEQDAAALYVGMQVDVFLNGDGTSMSAK